VRGEKKGEKEGRILRAGKKSKIREPREENAQKVTKENSDRSRGEP